MRKTETHFSLPAKLKPLSIAVLMALGSTGAEAATIQLRFSNSTNADVVGTGSNYNACNMDFIEGREFRMCMPDNTTLNGGVPHQKSTIDGSELWNFDAATGLMTSVTNTASTPGVSDTVKSYITMGYLPASGAPDGGTSIDQGTLIFGVPFGFLAPTLGSGAGNLYGEGQYTATSATTFELFFPVLEGQWGGAYFQLGSGGNNGITFLGTTDGANFDMWAEHTIVSDEDVLGVGFTDWTIQWHYTGTIVPIPAAVWLFGSGLLGLLGFARRNKTV